MIFLHICIAIYLLGILPIWAFAKRIEGIDTKTRVIGTILWPIMVLISMGAKA
jgi:hypothetical protein